MLGFPVVARFALVLALLGLAAAAGRSCSYEPPPPALEPARPLRPLAPPPGKLYYDRVPSKD